MNNSCMNMALLLRAFFIFSTPVLFIASCGIYEKNHSIYRDLRIQKDDYIDHFEHLSDDYLKSPKIIEIKLGAKDLNYLKNLYKRIVLNNELILTRKLEPKFHIIKSELPFYFSLPSGRFFLSDSLIKKYTKSENLLVSLLANEIYRVHKRLYKKKLYIPIGFAGTTKMLSLHRLPLKIRVESLKWTYLLLKRSGYDPYSVLSWIQTQNKNSLEFTAQSGNRQSQTREEFLLKGFLAQKTGTRKSEDGGSEQNSSKGFYSLQRTLL